METQDPVSMIFAGAHGPDNEGRLEPFHDHVIEEQINQRLQATIQGKRFLNISGGDDKLVPYRCSLPFVQWLSRVAARQDPVYHCNFHFEDKIFSGVGHSLSRPMAEAVDRFVVDSVASFWNLDSGKTPKI